MVRQLFKTKMNLFSCSVSYYILKGKVSDALCVACISTGHGAQDLMIKELSNRYKNITCHDKVLVLLELHKLCYQKKKKVVHKPLLLSESNSH
jgi:hypothetical protein